MTYADGLKRESRERMTTLKSLVKQAGWIQSSACSDQ